MAWTLNHQRYWRKTLALTGALLLVWLAVTFGVTYYARELSFRFFGWPFSFWMAAQGGLVIYVLIVAVYTSVMRRLDMRHGFDESEAD